MRSIIQWAVRNSPAVNMIVFATLAGGLICFSWLRREMFPEFELEIVLVTVPYPGASPADVEKGICQPLEEAVRSLDGVKQVISVAKESSGFVLLELYTSVRDVQKVVADIRSAVDRIRNFPELAEDPTVQQMTFRDTAIRVALLGPETNTLDAELRLREVAEQVREDLLRLPSISQADLRGGKNYQIDVEISEATLRKHGLTLGQVAQILRRENAEMPAGQLRSDSQEILLRSKNRREVGEELKSLPIIAQSGGAVLTVGDLGRVVDEFEDSPKINEINGKPSLMINVQRTTEEDLISICQEVHDYVNNQVRLPEGYSLVVWGDTSIDVADRLKMLRQNGVQGLILVFIILALFLEFRLAFWVAMGIPISVLGASIILYLTDQTLNMLSMFSFLMALGIVVDDAIVVGENIHSHRMMGKDFLRASIDGAIEVIPSVFAAVSTTMIAFLPFFFVSGVMGKFIAVMPVAILAMLAISLVEASIALPCHLAHQAPHKSKNPIQLMAHYLGVAMTPLMVVANAASRVCGGMMEWVGDRVYLPTLRFLLRYPLLGLGISLFLILGTAGMVKIGFVPFVPFPSSDSKQIFAQVLFSDGTPAAITDRATKQLEDALWRVSEELYEQERAEYGDDAVSGQKSTGSGPNGPVKLTFRQVGTVREQGPFGNGQDAGSNAGQIIAELIDPTLRSIQSSELINLWRQAAGEVQGAERVSFQAEGVGPGGNPIEFRLLAVSEKSEQLFAAIEEAKQHLATYKGVYDIRDDAADGKIEYQIKVKQRAQAMGITTMDLAETIRNSYYGAEAMRMQRGRQEVKLMVRYPENERTALTRFNEIFIRRPDGAEIPITELADITVTRGYSEINRLDQLRSITVSADLNTGEGNAQDIIAKLRSDFFPNQMKAKFPDVYVSWEGQQKNTTESLSSLMIGCSAAMVLMFLLLVVEFRSYIQPLLILMIVPFGVIGAVWGHAIMGIEVTLFSFFGLVALTGVVVNDSIVLVDFINSRVRSGMPYDQALAEAGRRRMRPVFLTSMTTIAGLVPLLMEGSFQAQFLKPMATSIAFGLMLSTALVLFQVPVFLKLYLMFLSTCGIDPSETFEHDEPGESPADSVAAHPAASI
ncbi:MAG: efflux RND transporter permease subunit [Pirellulaceae bacterium]|nr:efflux RND transporter permease subunit [Pirellulaceae bacterium]